MKDRNETVNYLSHDQALDLVDRIAERAERFNHTMHDNEKEAMAQLLSDVGVKTSDLIDVAYLADNYAINAEIVRANEQSSYDKETLEDALFSWEDENGVNYCLSW